MDRVKGLMGWAPAPGTPGTPGTPSTAGAAAPGTAAAATPAPAPAPSNHVTGDMPLEHIQRAVAATKQAYDACEAKRMTAVTNGKEAGDCEEQFVAFKRAFEAQIAAEATIYNKRG